MNRSALVTGATGFIAGHLVPALVSAGWEVRATARRARPAWLPDEVDYRPADLAGDDDLTPLLDGVSHVFHLAGASSSRSSQEEMQRNNEGATERLAGAALAAGVDRLLHMSTTAVYGEEVQLPLPVLEDVEPHPSRGYGKTKLDAERVVWRLVDRGLPAVVVRPVTVYGPGNTKLLASAILDTAIERFAGLAALAVPAQPIEQRLLHIDDLVSASIHLVEHPAAAGRAFNVASGSYPTSHELAGVLAHDFALDVELTDDPDAGLGAEKRAAVRDEMLAHGMQDHILLTPDRLRLMRKANRNNRISIDALLGTGFVMRHVDVATSVPETIAWYRKQRWVL